MPLAAVSIGSNLDPIHHIEGALKGLRNRFEKVKASPVYQTMAIGFDGPDFYNLVVTFCTQLAANALIDQLHSMESDQGRVRSNGAVTSRVIDLDLLLYGDAVLYGQGLDVPRREILEYAFVLSPLSDLLPDMAHPVVGDSFKALSEASGATLQRAPWQPADSLLND
jgi:2-amino-4-hydroxy-6-hydroxymethyldihydropteridine diphosphokinase